MPNRFDYLIKQLLDELRSAEKQHRDAYGEASDNRNWANADLELALIRRIVSWRRAIDTLCDEITESGVITGEDISDDILGGFAKAESRISTSILEEDCSDEKIGKYIRGKLRELSNSGFVFSAEQITDMCNAEWSHRTFSYQSRILPFARVANYVDDLSSQIKDEKGNNRYWNEIFSFGDYRLLIFSQWYSKDKDDFDKWYESISTPPNTQGRTITIRAKRRDIGESKVEVATVLAPILTFQTEDIQISARLIDDLDSDKIAFCAVVKGIASKEKIIPVERLEAVALLNSSERIHSVSVPTSVNKSEKMHFMAWIDPPEGTGKNINSKIEQLDQWKRPTGFLLFSKDYEVSSWDELYVKICEILLLHRPYVMATMNKDMDFNTENRTDFSYIKSEIKLSGKRLSNGLWIETDQGSENTIAKCNKLLEKCGFSPDELQVVTMEVQA